MKFRPHPLSKPLPNWLDDSGVGCLWVVVLLVLAVFGALFK